MKKRHLSRLLILILCAVMLSTGMMVQAAEPVPYCNYIPIHRNNQVVDTLNGVDALYNLDGYSVHWCIEVVERYYETLYGINIYLTGSGPVVYNNPNDQEYWFEKLDSDAVLQTGDVMFGASYLRGKSYNHWALVKSFDQYTNEVTVFEQNWRYEGKAGIDRILEYPTKYYYFYRLMCEDGVVQPNLREIDQFTSDAGRKAADLASKLGIAAVADGFRKTITAEEFLRMCCNTIRAATGESQHADPKDPIAAAVSLGLISKGSWTADDPVTREKAAVILVRLAELLHDQPETNEQVLSLFADACQVGMSFRPFAARAAGLGLLSFEDDHFLPQDGLTVEQTLISLTGLAQSPVCEVVLQYEPTAPTAETSAPAGNLVAADGSSAASTTASILSDLRRK